jgi:hypothetical protein
VRVGDIMALLVINHYHLFYEDLVIVITTVIIMVFIIQVLQVFSPQLFSHLYVVILIYEAIPLS